jgi:hypothetical protein
VHKSASIEKRQLQPVTQRIPEKKNMAALRIALQPVAG